MVVEHEYLHVRRFQRELLIDPAVASAADLAVIQVGLAGVDGDDRDRPFPQDRVPLSEHLLEVHVPDVARVVVSGNDDECVAVDPVEILPGGQILVSEAEGREVARAHDDVWRRHPFHGQVKLVSFALDTLEYAKFTGAIEDEVTTRT